MHITETRLRQIVLEEVQLRLIKETIRKVVDEANLSLTENERLLFEVSVLDALKTVAKKAGIPLLSLAAIAFGSEIGQNLYDLEGVGVTPAYSQQIKNAETTAKNIRARRRGMIDIKVGPEDTQTRTTEYAMNTLIDNYVKKGKAKSTGQAQAGTEGATMIIYVPYDSLPEGYSDAMTQNSPKEDLKRYYQSEDIESLKKMVADFNMWQTGEARGSFTTTKVGDQTVAVLPASWSIAFKALEDKYEKRQAKGKPLPNL
tara:strand:+ start:278 stop:1051 length:774 start_codon:yes stop_codon:yes gene_type:complete